MPPLLRLKHAPLRLAPAHVTYTRPSHGFWYGNHLVGWAVLLAAAGLLTQEILGSPLLLSVGSYQLNNTDITATYMLLACLVSYARIRLKRTTTLIVALLSAVYCFSLLRGMAIAPVPALMSIRSTGLIALFLLLGLSARQGGTELKAAEKALLIAAPVLCFISISRRILGPSFLYLRPVDFVALEIRPLNAASALLLAVTAILILARALRGTGRTSGRDWGLYVVLSSAVAVSAQGTATICWLVGSLFTLGFQPGRAASGRFMIFLLLMSLLVALVSLAPNILAPEHWRGVLPPAAIEFLEQRAGTNMTRQFVWAAFLASVSDWSPTNIAIGWPAGQRPYLLVRELWDGLYWNNSLHSMYFQMISDLGLSGLALYVTLLVLVIVSSVMACFFAPMRKLYGAPAIGLVIAVMVALYSYSYDLRGNVAVVLMIMLLARSAEPIMAPRQR